MSKENIYMIYTPQVKNYKKTYMDHTLTLHYFHQTVVVVWVVPSEQMTYNSCGSYVISTKMMWNEHTSVSTDVPIPSAL